MLFPVWLENIFNSPAIGLLRLLNKRFGLAGSLFNHFDGQVDLLDDLDDHYTARNHKAERKDLILRFQELSLKHDIRITILGGDVHLAATGRFYSKPKLGISAEHDHRYMVNVISSAITNKPPPMLVANLLARRNKIHRLDHDTHETLMGLFDRDPGRTPKTAAWNHCTMPSRNYATITEAPAGKPRIDEQVADGEPNDSAAIAAHTNGASSTSHPNGHHALHPGEKGAGTTHPAASGDSSGLLPGGLDVSIRVEIDQHDPEGRTVGYGFSSECNLLLWKGVGDEADGGCSTPVEEEG